MESSASFSSRALDGDVILLLSIEDMGIDDNERNLLILYDVFPPSIEAMGIEDKERNLLMTDALFSPGLFCFSKDTFLKLAILDLVDMIVDRSENVMIFRGFFSCIAEGS